MSASAWTLSVEQGIGRLVFDDKEAELNILTFNNLSALNQILDEIGKRADIKTLVISSGKSRIFIAGADIKQIEGIKSTDEAISKAEQGKAILQKIENFSFPTLCVINGACLGGGYELALACRYRVASFSPNVKIGLPEVNLGILPGFGGSIRLPRLLGLIKALPLILTGRVVSAQEALRFGMVDKLLPEKTLQEDAISEARKLSQGGSLRKPKKKDWMTWFLEDTGTGRSIVFSRAKKDVLAKTKGHYPGPFEIIKLISATYGKKGAGVYRKESEAFSHLAITDVSKNVIKVFYLTEKYKKNRWTGSKATSDGVQKCGIVGAGVMGGGIAQLVSYRDIPVRVKDLNEKALGGALKEAYGVYKSAMKRRKVKPHELENKMNLISAGVTNQGLKNCDMIIEAVIEDLGVKQKVFKELDALAGPQTILASNTSSLSVEKMAEGCRYPERIVGLHFFNPVSRMPLVEVIRTFKSSEDAIERTVLFARRLGKTVIVVEDRPGFVVNRLLLPYMNEAAYLLQEGFSAERIDKLVEAFGMPMGPIELADQVGLDVAYKVAHILQDAFGDRMKVAPVLEEVKKTGLLGKKAGKGFYVYEGKSKKPNPDIKTGTSPKGSEEDALKRMLYIMINEAARILEEKVADSAASIDIGMIMGTGFPPFQGGLLRAADTIGIAEILKDLERFRKEVDSKRFEPCAYLRNLATDRKTFYNPA